MARRRLDLDVSIAEMLKLREQKMSVKEIAKSLDVHPNTVYRYIGPEPKKTRPPQKTQQGSVGKAMIKAFNAKYNQESKRSMQTCKSCSNRGVACSFCLRNPMLKDYYQKENSI